ncbi:nudC domain-containing protein 1 [Megalops cyprinoides]|uniref:nudC domain-containing protein 1 n=1 Tax=Megalops cyprinoides TaxID=118141 RepID=UPI001864C3F8|nr:nudC domain-containing protein 1 [Megalops cyprinoides]
MAASNCSLKINRQLLDPNFESYRLSLDPLPSYKIQLDAAVAEVKLEDHQYTLDHVRAFGMYNYLHLDPWYEDSIYFIDCMGRVLNLTVTLDTALGKPREVFCMPSNPNLCESRLCASLSLTSATWAALSDGTGRLYLLRTGRRDEGALSRWELLFSESMGEPFIIVHSLSHVHAGVESVELLLLRIQKDQSEAKGSGFSVFLEWLTVTSARGHDEEQRHKVRKRRLLQGKSVPDYAAVEPQGQGLMVASEKPFRFTHVDGEPLENSASEAMELDEKTEPVYFWQQTTEDITVTVRLPEDSTKDVVDFRLSPDNLTLGVQGHTPLLEGQLHALVDPTASTWNFQDDQSLEVFLQKKTKGPMWPQLLIGDRGEEFVMNERLTDECISAAELNDNTEKGKPPCNVQELEDCDTFPGDSSSLMRFDEKTLKPTHVVNLGSHQFLFTLAVSPSEMPCFCLRHDVDALLWQPRPDQTDSMWEHIATFNALGYIQASKRDKKFSTCAPNFSYAALGECLRRVFIYRQPSPVDTVLFNRKQGRQVGQVAKQQVSSLDSNETVLGFRATNERLFVLISNYLFVLKVNN